MTAFKLAFRNLFGAGLRTWLNVFVLALAYIMIIWHKGLIDGWDRQAQRDLRDWQYAGGQYWHPEYDPYDIFTLEDSHVTFDETVSKAISNDEICPILIEQGSIYPEGRLVTVFIKGIKTDQQIVKIPSEKLQVDIPEIPAIIGKRLAKNAYLKKGDVIMLRWRDANGTFDAGEIKIVDIFSCNVPAVDMQQIWIPIEKLQEMLVRPNQATILVQTKENDESLNFATWEFKDLDFLTSDMKEMIKMKSIGGAIFYIILMSLALLAIFDTQVLSIFRRQKEIGTFIALGMTRGEVVKLFTIEGAVHALLAAVVGAILGAPLFYTQLKYGFKLPADTDDFGITMADVMYPYYGMGLVIGTIIIVFLTTALVSYLPARKISKMKPTDAIRGKLQ